MLKRRSKSASRKTRAILYLTVCGLILAVLSGYAIKEYYKEYKDKKRPVRLSVEEQFRADEIRNMVGPGKILANMSLRKYTVMGDYDSLLVASTEKGFETYLYDEAGKSLPVFNYREKQGDITVLSVPEILWYGWPFCEEETRLRIPVFLFDNYPQAVRAEIDMELSAIYDPDGGHIYRNTYHLAADRTTEGYFLLELSARNFGRLDEEGRAIYYLTDFSKGCEIPLVAHYEYIPIYVRLYDQNENLVCNKYIELRTPGGDKRLERGDNSW